jgi:hypothetical protein
MVCILLLLDSLTSYRKTAPMILDVNVYCEVLLASSQTNFPQESLLPYFACPVGYIQKVLEIVSVFAFR